MERADLSGDASALLRRCDDLFKQWAQWVSYGQDYTPEAKHNRNQAAQRLETQMRAAPHALTDLLGPGSPLSVETQVFLVSWALNLDLNEEEAKRWRVEVWKWRAHLSDYDIRLGRTILHHLSSFELRYGRLQ